IQVVSQEALPKWDVAFGDLYAQVERARSGQVAKLPPGRTPAGKATAKGAPMARAKKPGVKGSQTAADAKRRLYTLEVFLLSGPITEKFARKNPVVSRTIQMRGDQTLEDLHHALFGAFGRWEEHLYEFQFGKGPMDPKGPRYVLRSALQSE